MNVVVSTVGTSLLTNLLTTDDRQQGWYQILRDSTNLREEQTDAETLKIIDTLLERAGIILQSGDNKKISRISAELNGILKFYDNQLEHNSNDIHFLVSTDTAQGMKTAGLIQKFLREQGFLAEILTPSQLCTRDTQAFHKGVQNLIQWMDSNIKGYKNSKYRIIFNLVGGFKSIQGYMNTIGMFYADEIIYIFESEKADLIKIPRLPIKVDLQIFQKHAVNFALMAEGSLLENEKMEIPESLIESDCKFTTLSPWGLLSWNNVKHEILSGDLLSFPYIEYKKEFIKDYKSIADSIEKVFLQEKLAKVSSILKDSQGDIVALRNDKGLQYEDYNETRDGHKVGHFRITQKIRISCQKINDKLILRRYDRNHERLI